jgi:hypothetical protein
MRHITNQDRHVNTLTQIGLRSSSASRGRTSYQEESSVRFARWLVAQYKSAWPESGEGSAPARTVIPIREQASA